MSSLTPSPGRSAPPHDPVIVVPVVAGIGNALLAVPMVRALKRHFPAALITVLARTDAIAEVFRRQMEVAEVLVTGTGLGGVMRMIRAARQRKPDVYLIPFPSNRWQYSLLAATSGAKRRVLHGYPAGYWRALHFLSATRVPAVRGIHDVEQNLRLLMALGVESRARDLESLAPGVAALESNAPVFPLTDEDRSRGATLLERHGIYSPFIAIHAGSAQTILAAAKRWPPDRYATLVDALRREFDDPVVLLEGPDEVGVTEEILRGRGDAARVLRLSGPLGESAAVLARARLYVGSDSGLAHLSAAVGTRAVTLFAPADPDRVCPYGNRDLVVQAPTPCAPCFLYPWNSPRPKMRCQPPLCIGQITVEAVMSAVHRALKSATTSSPDPKKAEPKNGESKKGDIHLFSKLREEGGL